MKIDKSIPHISRRKFAKLCGIMLTFACVLSGCNAFYEPDAEKCATYKCYDYHLACLKTEGKIPMEEMTYEVIGYNDNGEVRSEHTMSNYVQFQKIVGESEDQFIYANILPPIPLGGNIKAVLQNPQQYVDVWQDWTVRKIEIFICKSNTKQGSSAIKPDEVITSTADPVYIDELKTYILSTDTSEPGVKTEGAKRIFPTDHTRPYHVYIRVYFEESEYIVWDNEIDGYATSNGMIRNLRMDVARTPTNIATPSQHYIYIDREGALYEWIWQAVDNISVS